MWNSLFADNCHKLNVFGMCAKHPKVRLVGGCASLQIFLRINSSFLQKNIDRIIFLSFLNDLKVHIKIAFLQIVKLDGTFYYTKINSWSCPCLTDLLKAQTNSDWNSYEY